MTPFQFDAHHAPRSDLLFVAGVRSVPRLVGYLSRYNVLVTQSRWLSSLKEVSFFR